jgi:tRNA (guanine-N7-)-methyltransferase
MRTKFKRWAIPYLNEHPEVVINDIHDQFLNSDCLYLEIGSGKGDFIVEMAKNHPELNFLAVEMNSSVSGIACRKIVDSKLSNIRLMVSNINDQFQELDGEIFSGIFLNFSDPWPKARHEKRRLTYYKNINEYYRLLKSGSCLYFKSDNYDFYLYSEKSFQNSKFVMILDTDNYIFDPTFDAQSEYEKLFRSRGVKINKMILRK